MNALQQRAFDYFAGLGWTAPQAAGFVANAWAESHLDTQAVGDSGAGVGICQWHPDRQERALALGKRIQDRTLEEQIDFAHWELGHTEHRAGELLQQCTGASAAAAVVCEHFERPADISGESYRRAQIAEQIYADYMASVGGVAPQPPVGPAPEPVAAKEAPMGLGILLPTLLQTIAGIFQPRIAQQLEKVSGQPSDQLMPMLTTFFTQAGQALGILAQGQQIATPQQAVAIASAAQNAPEEKVAQLQDYALQLIDHTLPLIDKMYEQEAASNAATREGRNQAAQRGSERGRMVMVGIVGFLSACVVLGILGALIFQIVVSESHEPSVALVGFGGPILTLAIKYLGDCVAFYMDGTPASNAAMAANQVLAAAVEKPR